jgi:hypothetical protein
MRIINLPIFFFLHTAEQRIERQLASPNSKVSFQLFFFVDCKLIKKKLFKQIFDEIIGKGELSAPVGCVCKFFVLFEVRIYRKVCVWASAA